MSRRLAATVAALLAAAACATPAFADTGGAPPPLDPTTAQQLADAAAVLPSGSTSWSVTPAQALAASAAPGATTWVDPSMSPQSAVGETASQSVDSLNALSPPKWCWATAFWHQWGTWPYQQRVTDTTYWCAVLGVRITYRSSSVVGSGTLCGTNWTSSQLISGGYGYPWFTMRSSAGFACPTVIPWIVLHENRHVDVVRTDTGGTKEAGSG